VLQNLVTLDLSNNQLDSLPYSMGYMKSLQELNLAGNPLREFGKLFDQKPEKYAAPSPSHTAWSCRRRRRC
jgi:Leucine-rich repeat (LRR) protein